jgi:methylated-DNA-[protein]-cysteine S-methyltransferase
MVNESFTEIVRTCVRSIPKGEVRSYAEVAQMAQRPRAARAVANIMAKNFDPSVPCHRVIRSDGHVGGYNRGGPARKAALLAVEGVTVVGLRVIDYFSTT